ncbi:MAG: hypothetical protein AAGF33_10440 [Pseudomonadota bacterium]
MTRPENTPSKPLLSSDIEYVADMLRAVFWVKEDLRGVPDQTLEKLARKLPDAEEVLREVAEQMKAHTETF